MSLRGKRRAVLSVEHGEHVGRGRYRYRLTLDCGHVVAVVRPKFQTDPGHGHCSDPGCVMAEAER